MKLYVRDGKIQTASFFKFAFIGVLIGEGLIFVIPFVLISGAMLNSLLTGVPIFGDTPQEIFYVLPFVFPIVVLMHALMFGAMTVFGLWLYSRFGRLEIAEDP